MALEKKQNSEFNSDGTSIVYPWLTYSTMEYTYDKGYQFIEYQKFLSSKINEKVAQADFYNGVRYLKIKLLGEMTAERYYQLEEVDNDSKIQRKFCRVLENDLLELDLTQKELEEGFRYLKIYLPYGTFESGWITFSEQNDGWQISGKHRQANMFGSKKKRKFKKHEKESKMMEEVKKYISIKD